MKIVVDEEGRKAIEEMCDMALKVSGIRNLNRVGQILAGVRMEEEPPQSDAGEKDGEVQSAS